MANEAADKLAKLLVKLADRGNLTKAANFLKMLVLLNKQPKKQVQCKYMCYMYRKT